MIDLPKDNIGRQLLVDKIKYLIETLPEGNHFCLSLDGNWGSGKSYVIGMLQNQLEQSPECFVIHYDAWKNSFYSEPLIAILSCVIDTMQSKLSEIKGYNEVIKEAGKEAFNQLLKDNPIANKLNSVITTITKAIDKFRHPFQKDTTKGSIGEFKSYQSLLTDVQDCLNSIVDYKQCGDKINKIVILVDEIDRCLPDQQLIVLERLHHLFNIKNCAVIVALNKKAIYGTFNKQFGGDGEEYLRKFFNYNFIVETEYTILLTNLIKDFIGDINNSINQKEICTDKEIGHLLYALLSEFSRISTVRNVLYDNRAIIDYFNKFRKIWENHRWLNLPYISFFLFMVFYKLYDEEDFIDYKNGAGDFSFKTFNFGIDKRLINLLETCPYYIYKNNFCDNFTYLMNCIRFRNSSNVLDWLDKLNTTHYLHLYIFTNEIKDEVDKCFEEIDNYGNMK